MSKNAFDDSLAVRPNFINLVFQQLEMFLSPDTIDWRCDAQNVRFSPEIICNTFYKPDLETVRHEFMKAPAGRVDRHKIIALTQMIIVNLQPLTFRDSRKTADEIFGLNVDFAFLFGLQFLVRWNERYYPEQRFCEPVNHFPTEVFLFRLNETKEGNDFWREHRKWFMARKHSRVFPLFLVAQMWFLLEQWGLEYMRHQPRVPREKPISEILGV
ncbi:MAG: hypothetical protein LBI05_04265 [Planctomycetaceae bacterium]|jgi:hypothetical protein|nr:hypothetical protein [Planctomycetaceae bacterium]